MPKPLRKAKTELIRTTWPRCAITCGSAAATVFATPVTLTAKVASMSAVGVLRRVAAFARSPALAITTSSRPKWSTVCATAASRKARSRTSATHPKALVGCSSTARSGVVGSMSAIPTLAPRSSSARAVAAPDPAVPTGDEDDLVGEVVRHAAHFKPRRGVSDPAALAMRLGRRTPDGRSSGSASEAMGCSRLRLTYGRNIMIIMLR